MLSVAVLKPLSYAQRRMSFCDRLSEEAIFYLRSRIVFDFYTKVEAC